MKKTFIMFLAMLACVISGYAQTFEVDGISYSVTKQPNGESSGEVAVTGGGIKEVIEIPETVTYNDVTYTVTSIGNGAFRGRSNSGNYTKKYIIPGTVRTIGSSAFYDNYYLEEVEFNEGLQTIGNDAFGFNFQLKEIRIPSTVTSIENRAFRTNRKNLATISCLAETPPSNLGSETFQGRTDATLHVVASDVEAYSETEYWKEFSNIVGDIQYRFRCNPPVITCENNILTISCKTENATIYYTTDCSVPDENAIRYTSPISYSSQSYSSQILRAIAMAEGMENSVVNNFYDKEQMDNVTDEQGVRYTLKQLADGSVCYSVTGHSSGMNAEIVIPAYLGGCPVKTIDGFSFNGCSSLLSITIPYTITSIGEAAFQNCSSLTSFTIPNSVTSIGGYAFNYCKGLSSIIIPGSVTSIGENAFQGCWNLKNVKVIITDYSEFCSNHILEVFDGAQLIDINGNEIEEFIIPEGVTTIVKSAFRRCSGLSSVTIPNSVTTIGEEAFYGCSGLKMVTSEISTPFAVNAFSGCFNATLVVPKGSRAAYKSVGGWNFAFIYEEGETIYDRELADEQGIYYTLKTDNNVVYYSVTGHSDKMNAEIVIPANIDGCPVKTIEKEVFQYCTSLSSISIPNSVTSIGSSAFNGCSSLSSINIPKSVTSLGAGTFANCSSLTSITIPNSVTKIEDGASRSSIYINNGIYRYDYRGVFYGCSSLTSVKIGNGVSSIGKGAFAECISLTSVKMGENVSCIGDNAFHNCSSLTFFTLPNMLESIGSFAFDGCRNLTSVSFDDGLISIGDYAFNDCALTSITIPNSVTTIGNNAFYNNKNLTTAILRDGITEIKTGTFENCNALNSVIIPDAVTNIGSGAFFGCRALISIKLPESLTSMGGQVFEYCPLKSIELPDAFTTIPEGLFIYNNFQYIKLGNNVKSIGKNAFGSSSELVIEIGTSTPPTIDKDAFPNIAYLSDLNVIVPDAKAETAYRKAAVWQEMTFSTQNNIAEVTVDTPGDLSFELIEQCDMMPAKVVGLKVNGTINADDFNQMLVNMKSLLRLDLSDCNITAIPDNALKGKLQLQELILPTSLQTIGKSAFQGCTGLTSAIWGNQLTTIGESAFQGCTLLTGELGLPSTVTSIGASAFTGTYYTSVKMPNALKTIGDYAFNNIPIKQQLSLPGSVTSVGTSAFEGTKIESLSIPRSVKTIGNRAFAGTQIKSLSIKEGVTSIGDEAFAGTPIQDHVTIPDGVTYLGSGAFRNSQLSTVFLPNSVTTLSQGLFQGCPNLDLVYVPDNYTAMSSYAFDGCGDLTILRLSANTESMGEYSLQNTPLEYVKVPAPVEVLPRGVLKNCKSLESLSLPANLKSVEAEALTGCTALRNLSVEAIEPPVIKDKSAIRGINTDLCLISIPTQSFRAYVLAEYWGQFVQMRNDIAVETVGNGKIGFESADEEEEGEEASYARRHGRRSAAARGRRGAAPQLAEDEDSLTYANNGSSVYVPKQGKVRFYIIPAEGEEILSATLDGEDIMPYIVDGVYVATADKRNAKLVVVFSGSGQGSVGLQGDVNGDGEVSVTDVGCVINYILEQVPETFIYAAADMNGDETISVTDVGYIINYILNDGFACRAEQNVIYHYGEPMLMPDTNGYVMALDGADAFIAFQMDIIVPEDANGCNVQLKDTGTNHQLACRRLAGGHYRVVCYSPNNETFQKGLTDLLTLASEGDMTVSNIRFTTESLNEVCFDDMSATPTSIASVTDLKTNDIKVYTLEGQLYRTVHARHGENPLKDLKPGIYLINERKYIVK